MNLYCSLLSNLKYVGVLLWICGNTTIAQVQAPTFFLTDNPFSHTYSIVARDPQTGDLGVAVQSHWFSVGSDVTWGEAGVGVVATQSFVNPAFGPDGLALLKKGYTAQQALDSLLAADEGRDVRQVAIADAKGNVAAHTGKKCIAEAGHKTGNGYSVQANLMEKNTVWPAMAQAFERTKGPLAERLVAALEAAQKEGGDIRGQQSAAILVVKAQPSGQVWRDRLVELRVEDHRQPVAELKRLLKVHRAYEQMNAGDIAMEKGRGEEAMQHYTQADKLLPNNEEMMYWRAVTLIGSGKINEAIPLFKKVFKQNKKWRILIPRLVNAGLLPDDKQLIQKITSIK